MEEGDGVENLLDFIITRIRVTLEHGENQGSGSTPPNGHRYIGYLPILAGGLRRIPEPLLPELGEAGNRLGAAGTVRQGRKAKLAREGGEAVG